MNREFQGQASIYGVDVWAREGCYMVSENQVNRNVTFLSGNGRVCGGVGRREV